MSVSPPLPVSPPSSSPSSSTLPLSDLQPQQNSSNPPPQQNGGGILHPPVLPPGMPMIPGPPPPPPLEISVPSLKPNRTLYVNNLNSKIKTEKLKKELRAIFENFGDVRDIIAMKSFWRRGQAWVIFSNQESADKALTSLQGFPYQGKEMRIQYAREMSDIFAKEDGIFVERPPGPKKPRAIVEREQRLQAQLQQFQQMMKQHMAQMAAAAAAVQPSGGQSVLQIGLPGMGLPSLSSQQQTPHDSRAATLPGHTQMSKEETVAAAAKAAAAAVEAAAKKRAAEAAAHHVTKIARTTEMATTGFNSHGGFSSQPPPAMSPGLFGPHSMPSPPGPSSPASGLPNPTLFIENLPDDCDAVQLKAVFSQYSGCKDIRHIAAKKVAFVDYETIPQASVALRCLNNFSIKEGQQIRVSYAK